MASLAVNAKDKSTIGVTATFTDADGSSVVPVSITWTLTDKEGTIINNRDQVVVATPAASIDIVLSGDDLDIGNTLGAGYVVLLVESVINSVLGNGLPYKDQVNVLIDDLVAIS